jgi:hypothetical protein
MTLSSRQQAAIEMLSSGALDQLIEVGVAHRLVPSACVDGAFYVTSSSECTCPDARHRGVTCKHQWALRVQAMFETDEPAPRLTAVGGRMPQTERED